MKLNRTAVLFPGQGSQFVGMGREFLEASESARSLMDMAEHVSGFPIRKLCMEGPLEELTRTVYLQPAVTVLNLICWQAAREAGFFTAFAAGHSLGEYSALAAAGVLTPEETIQLVTERGKLMEREASSNPGSMRAVLGLPLADVNAVLAGLNGPGVVVAANHNTETQIVISGDLAALDSAETALTSQGAKVVALPVSGAWHSPLVAGAIPDFTKAMERVKFLQPTLPIFFNVTSAEETEPEKIRDIMARQIASPVRWYDIVSRLLNAGVRNFVELGPKNVLTGIVKKCIPKGTECHLIQVDTPEKLATSLAKIQMLEAV